MFNIIATKQSMTIYYNYNYSDFLFSHCNCLCLSFLCHRSQTELKITHHTIEL